LFYPQLKVRYSAPIYFREFFIFLIFASHIFKGLLLGAYL
jgi:hypothetical protein